MTREDDIERHRLLAELESLQAQLERAEASAQVREFRAQLLLDEMFEFVALLSPDGVVLHANRAALDLLGRDGAFVAGRPMWETGWWADLPESQDRLTHAIAAAAAGHFVRYEAVHWGDAERSRLITVDFSLKPVRGEDGTVAYLVAEGRDVTGRKRAEAALSRTSAELHDLSTRLEEDEGLRPRGSARQRASQRPLEGLDALAADLSDRRRELEAALEHTRIARAQAERALEVRERFLGLVSHELRTPLTTLRLHIQRLLRSGPPDRVASALEKMAAAEERLTGMVVALLEQARLDSGQLDHDATHLDFAALLDDICGEQRPNADRKCLGLSLECEADLPPLVGDSRLLRLIAGNLLDNAIKFTERGEVVVRAEFDGAAHRLLVRDTGPGISPDHQAEIFRPFWHADPLPCKHTPGVGLGLALVSQVVQALGGRVELESEVGKGSTFVVVLPVSQCETPDTLVG